MSISCRTESPGKFRHILKVGAHTLHADLGVAAGGEDSAPGAHDYFDLSLAACKALTAMRYSKTKGMPLEEVEIAMERDDSKESEGIYRLSLQIRFLGKLSPEEKERLFSVVSRCPVHKLMTSSEVLIEAQHLL
jgi:putative redox protein